MELYSFDTTMTQLRIALTDSDIIEAVETKEINKAGQLSLTVPATELYTKGIFETDIVLIKVSGDKFHAYKMTTRTIKGNTVVYKGIEYAYYLMAVDGVVHDKRPKELDIRHVMDEILIGTQFEVGYVSPNLPAYTGRFYWQTRLDCLTQLSKATGAEFEFYFSISQNKITKRAVDVYDKQGTDTHRIFNYGMNLLEVVAETDSTDLYTKVYGRGKGIEYSNGTDGTLEDASYGRRITFEDVEWSVSKGNPVDKPKGQDYVTDGTNNWRLDNGNDPSKILVFENIDDPEVLLQQSYEWLIQNNHPKTQFKATIGNIGDLQLGDRVIIKREDLGITYVTRVFKVKRNLLNEKLTQVELGDQVSTSLIDSIGSIQSAVDHVVNNQSKIDSQISFIDGTGAKVTYGPDEPATKSKGDLWYKPSDIVNGVQQYELLMWDGDKWVTVLGSKTFEELHNAINNVDKEVKEAQKQAQAASDKATQIEKDFTTSINDIKADVQNVETSAQNAMSQAQKAIDKANFNDTAITDIKNQQSADGQRLTTVESNYNGLNQTVKDNAAKQESDRAQLSGLISDKVSNSEFDSFKVQTADKITNIITNTNNLFVNSSMEDLPLDQTFKWIDHPEKVAIIDNPFKDFKKLDNVVVRDGFSYVNNKSPKVLKIQTGGKVTAPGFKVTGGTRFYMEFDFYSNTGSGWLLGVLQHGENGWWSSGGPYTYQTFDQDKWCHWRGYFDLEPQCTSVDFSFNPVGGTEDSITYFDNIVCTKANIMTSMIQQTQSDITSLVQNTDSLNKRIQTAETTVESISNMTGSNIIVNTVKGQQQQITNAEGDILKLTQTADGIVASVGNINNRIGYTYPNFTSTDEGVLHELYELSDGNTWEHIYLSKYSPSSAKTYYQLGFNTNNLPIGQKTGVRLKEYIDITGSTQFTLEFMSEMSAEDTSCAYGRYYLCEYDEHKNQLSNYEFWIKYDTVHDNYQNKATIKLNPATKYVRPVYVIESRGKACNFFLWDFKVYTDNQSISAQMAVLSDDVSLKVSKNDVVNQINVSTEEILIDGAKTHITNQTTIDNAVITSAMIKDINADTITTGTLNAANVNIVNLDVNRLTGNRGDFISAGIHDACHDLELTGGGITATFKDWSKMTLNTYGLQWRDKDGDPVGSITTEDWLLKNGIADTLLIGAYGGRQISIGLATQADEHLLETVFNVRRLDTNTRKDELTIELPNPYKTQICIGSVAAEHEYLRLENYALNNATYPYITGNSRNAGMFIGKNELYFRRTTSEGYAEVVSLGDIEYGKLKGLSNGSDNVVITNVSFDGSDYFALLSPSRQTGVMWGYSRLYFLLDGTVYPLADILRGATWNV